MYRYPYQGQYSGLTDQGGASIQFLNLENVFGILSIGIAFEVP